MNSTLHLWPTMRSSLVKSCRSALASRTAIRSIHVQESRAKVLCQSNNPGIGLRSCKASRSVFTAPIRWYSGPARHSKGASFASGAGYAFGLSATAVLLFGFSLIAPDTTHHDALQFAPADEPTTVGEELHHLFTVSEIAKHDRTAERKWVVRGTQVYDITDFIEAHPGGEVILRACGGSIDSYWKIFKIHDQAMVREILEQYHIGEVNPVELDQDGHVDWTSLGPGKGFVDDPFSDDPYRDPSLIVHTAKPCNAESPAELLTNYFITPTWLFFVRNHLWVPRIDPKKHMLTVEFLDGEESCLKLDQLRSNFEEHTITATLQCAGNRRKHMSESKKGKTSGLQWGVGAISTAEFTGVRLCDVLRSLGHQDSSDDDTDDKHIHFAASSDTYAASIPLSTALAKSSDVLLAYKMNGDPITRDHGGPLRVIVPGTTAARSVKWVDRITISTEEANSQWQRRDYKIHPPHIKATSVTEEDWDQAPSIQETPVQSVIGKIEDQGDSVLLKGFAFAGGGRAITRVDVSGDGGKTWYQAIKEADDAKDSKRWAWSLWQIELPKDQIAKNPADREFVVKATDDSYNSQPENFDSTWNFRGLLATAWHRVRLPSTDKERKNH